MSEPFQRHYLELVAEIEKRFPVAQWRRGDVDVWPLARMDLFLDMHWQHTGQTFSQPMHAGRRVLAALATPLVNIWKARRRLGSIRFLPCRADAILLGDGVSLDLVDGAWRDRFGEPLIAESERRGRCVFLMQAGSFNLQPNHRPTFAANTIDVWSRI